MRTEKPWVIVWAIPKNPIDVPCWMMVKHLERGWELPGGDKLDGEDNDIAALRELYEETGIKASIEKKINQVEFNEEGFKYILHNYSAIWTSGKPTAGSDALDAKFIKLNKLSKYKLWKKTQKTINAAYN